MRRWLWSFSCVATHATQHRQGNWSTIGMLSYARAFSLEHAALVTVDMRDASRVLYIDYLMLMCMTPTHSALFQGLR
jgi:hypothetical protein